MADKMMRIAGRTSGGIAVPMKADTDGNINTVRNWKTDIITLYSGSVPNTDSIRTTNTDLSEYPIISLRVTNRTGVSIILTPLVDLYNNNNGYELRDKDGGSLSVEIPYTSHFVVLTPSDTPWLNYVKYLRMKFSASATPTAETPTVEIYAVVRK